jgi:hypothetical protein
MTLIAANTVTAEARNGGFRRWRFLSSIGAGSGGKNKTHWQKALRQASGKTLIVRLC